MKNDYWKHIGGSYYENLIPVREKSTGIILAPGSCRITPKEEDSFEAVE